ncbi:MAG: hypothetical protein ACI3V5_09665 [Faecousia sp.]
MGQSAYEEIVALAMEDESLEKSVGYLYGQLSRFLKKKERVLICFPDHHRGGIGWLMEQAVLRCSAEPVLWGPEKTWKRLLQQAFFSHAGAIIAPPLIVLGLTKLKKYSGIPLYIRNAVTAGYPCLDWMIDGITGGLDCSSWGSFGLSITGVVAGFSCGCSQGVHLRDSEYGVDIVDAGGVSLPAGQVGEIVLYPKQKPQLRYYTGDNGRMEASPCKCGCAVPRIMDMQPGRTTDADLAELGQKLQSWTSVLDCRLNKGECGLELELVVFPGEKLPKLPTAARQIIRPWDPKCDKPFWYIPRIKDS